MRRSEIWQVALADAIVVRVIALPMPIMNFVTTANGNKLVATSPYDRAVVFLDTSTGQVVKTIKYFGSTPAEVMLLP